MKKLRKERLLKLTKSHGQVVLIVKDTHDDELRKRLVSEGSTIQWRSNVLGSFDDGQPSCFERKTNGAYYTPSIKGSIDRMFKYDKNCGFKVAYVLTTEGDVLWAE